MKWFLCGSFYCISIPILFFSFFSSLSLSIFLSLSLSFVCMVNVYTETKKYTIESAKEELEIDNIDFLNNQEVFEKDSGYIRSAVWMDMQRMLVRESNVLIENFVWCMHCKNMLPYCASTTTRLIDHIRKCKDRPHTDTDSVAKISFKMDELKPLRDAGARFVVMDFSACYRHRR